jgi:alkaline phosphatase D
MLSLSSILSSLFRLCSYIFLQIIPTRLAIPLLPVLYLLYLITACRPYSPVKHEKHTTGIYRTPPVSPISTILFSLPTKSRYLQYLNLIINTLLFLAALDFVVTPFVDTASDLVFTRVGALYPDSAKIVVRYPKANATEHTLLLVYRETPGNTLESSPPWKDGPHLQLNQSFDWVGTVRLASLWPGTSYECQSTCKYSFLDPYLFSRYLVRFEQDTITLST